MKNKIVWLSILGLALAKPPSPIDSAASNFGEQQKVRTSRSIWPFTSSATTTEAPVDYPPPLPDNNEWFVQGETELPQGIDLNKYPVWKVHKYNGIDLHPVKLHPENTYPPEIQHVADPGYYSGSSSSSDFSQNFNQNGYQDYETHSTGYPAAYPSSSGPYPAAEQENYQTGEFHSSSFTSGNNPFSIQTQQKYEAYAPPQSLQDFRAPAVPVAPERPQIQSSSYGQSNAYQAGSIGYQGYNQNGQKQVLGAGIEQSQSSSGGNPDLSFLDDLGGLATFLPEPTSNDESAQQEVSETPQEGFFEKLFSRFRGSADTPSADVAITKTENTANSGGFLSSIFGSRTDPELPAMESSATESSGSAFSSLFYQSETERPAVVLPTTYYLPKTRGSYIAVKIPTNAAPSFTPSIGQYDDVPNIAFHDVPRVPFTQHEIPKIPSPTLDAGYPYNLGYSEVRNSGFPGSAINSDYQPSIVHGQAHPPSSKIAPHFTQNYGSYQQSDLGVDDFSSNQGAVPDVPHAEYLHSANNNQQSSLPTSSSQSSSATRNYQRQQDLQDPRIPGIHQAPSTVVMPQSEDESRKSFLNTMTPFNADGVDQNQNLRTQEQQYQNFDTTSSNFQSTSNVQDTSDHNLDSFSVGHTVNENEPMSAPQISGGFVPSLNYGAPIAVADQLNSHTNTQENSQQTTSANENVAYDHSIDNIDDISTQDFIPSSALNRDLVPSEGMEPVGSSVPAYRAPMSGVQTPSNTPEQLDYGSLPVNEATDFHWTSSDQDAGDARFIQNLSALTSYGTPTNSYNSDSLVAASSNVRNFAMPAPMKDEVNDGVNINMNKDVFRYSLPEQLPTKKVGQVVRKVMKRRNLVESNHSRRSAPERQAPTEEADTSLIIRSEKDSIPEVRGSRQFHGTQVIDGYSKIQHHQHRVPADTAEAAEPVNPVLGSIQQ